MEEQKEIIEGQNVPLIRFENVTKIYSEDDNSVGIQDVNLDIFPGEVVVIVGPSGAGKSTLLKMIYSEVCPSNGTVYFSGDDIAKIKKRHIPYYRRNIGTVFQDFRLLPSKTVYENVAYALEVAGKDNEEIKRDIPEVLSLVGLSGKENKYPRQLSGGEQQKVALARALVHNPMMIVADEPTGNLDPVSTMDIVDLLSKINKMGTTIVLATHNMEVVKKIGRRVITMNEGSIVEDEIIEISNL